MGEDDDRRARGLVLEIVGEPGELSAPSRPRPPALRSTTLTRPMKCTPWSSKLYQPAPWSLAVAVEIGLAQALVDDVVLARNVVDVELGLTDDLISIVEFVRLRQMGDIARMDHEGWARLHSQFLHLANGFAQRAERVRIGRFIKADMAVADLQERERSSLCGESIAD